MAEAREDTTADLASMAEERFNAASSAADVRLADAVRLLAEYRAVCRSVVFSRIKHAPQSDVESQIWAAHSRLNTLFRTKVAKLRRVKDAAVESRLLLKKYLDFLKTSQIYYRAYILQLDEQFGGIEELREIARKWAPEGVLCRSVGVSSQQKEYVLQSCFQCLIHLGDLSRYRETEINQGQRNWAPAVGYYSLAAELCPTVGIAHNQLAVVALTEKNHLRAIYHLYRSLSLEEPHPSAQDNLELEFKKIINAQKKRAVGLAPNGNGANASLISWFVLLHSKCYRGELYSERDELQKEVLSQLISAIRERTLDSKLQMMFLINMAAEYVAASKLRNGLQSTANFTSFYWYLVLNIKTVKALLELLNEQLEQAKRDDVFVANQGKAHDLSCSVSVTMRTVLPSLHLYSTWLVRNCSLLSADLGVESIDLETADLWKTYVTGLNYLLQVFPPQDLHSVSYMLEEDVSIIGFKPLISEKTKVVWLDKGKPRAKFSDRKTERQTSNIEMLARVKYLIADGLKLALKSDDIPLAFEKGLFVYKKVVGADPDDRSAMLPTDGAAWLEKTTVHTSVVEEDKVEKDKAEEDKAEEANATSTERKPAASGMSSSVPNEDVAMERMVDNLVGIHNSTDRRPGGETDSLPTPPAQAGHETDAVGDPSPAYYSCSYSYSARQTGSDAADAAHASMTQSQRLQEAHAVPSFLRSSPTIRQPPVLPSLPDHSGIWNPKHNAAAAAAAQSSPMAPEARYSRHSRNPSFTSVGSSRFTVNGWPQSPSLSTIAIAHSLDYAQGFAGVGGGGGGGGSGGSMAGGYDSGGELYTTGPRPVPDDACTGTGTVSALRLSKTSLDRVPTGRASVSYHTGFGSPTFFNSRRATESALKLPVGRPSG